MHHLTSSAEELYNHYHKDIVRFFADHLTDRELAWDLCHEVFLRLLITLASGKQLSHPQGWLMRVAKNLLIDTYRHRQIVATRQLALSDQETAMLATDSRTFKTLLEREDMLQIIIEAFNAIPEKYRLLLFWREIERLPLQEISLQTGTTDSVLSTELWRARKLLQKEYQRLRFRDILHSDEEIFGHLDALLQFNVTAAPEEQLHQLEAHVHDYFEQIAPTWDNYVASAYEADLQERLTRLLPWNRSMTVLDAGTGTGYLASMIAPHVGHVIGVDCSSAMLAQAGVKMAQADYQHVSLHQGLAEQLPLATNSVDVAMCHMLLHHVVSPRTVLSELHRVIRPNGYLVIVDAHAHKHHWTPEAFGDLHYGTHLKKLRKHLSALQIKTLLVEDAGISHSGLSIGTDASFANFLLIGKISERGKRNQRIEEQEICAHGCLSTLSR
ncbi:sigma-70 family RNA polymerase sigma factor [Ktedonosporobacter rubrisoli]|uniref:Sigma-70 family RNA polymerase sigma factor n=1 Tax=Ktedonosporobacter rubrisoli TaxID=2509675 RepID=A0A4P6JP84_KTERU|nr:sigma-70 family RNA polymerase sigma factor [Ktedonosporobacter rubrisoli]QBD77075.1 sigma-70 family RNA polymerase sigma factor [Ktedonosporobacter rubrisoli]